MNRPYQTASLDRVRSDYLAGHHRLLGVMVTGGGKTRIMAQIPDTIQLAGRTVVLSHLDELVWQTAKTFDEMNPDRLVGIEKADLEARPDSDIVIASLQTLTARNGRRLKNISPEHVSALLIDEGHHATTKQYAAVMRHFGMYKPEFPSTGGRLLLAVTATPRRSDNVGLEKILDHVSFNVTAESLYAKGFLAPVHAERVDAPAELDDVGCRQGEFIESQLARTINTVQRNALVVETHARLLARFGWAPGLVYTANIQHSLDMEAAFRAAGFKAHAIVSGMDPQVRRQVISEYREGKVDLLASCLALSEGFNAPIATIGHMARPCRSRPWYQQCAGRLWRTHSSLNGGYSKRWAYLVDYVDHTTKYRLVTAPTLFRLPSGFDAAGGNLYDQAKQFDQIRLRYPARNLDDMRSVDQARREAGRIGLLEPPDVWPDAKKHSKYGWLTIDDETASLTYGPVDLVLHINPLGQHELYRMADGQRTKEGIFSTPEAFFAAADELVPPAERKMLEQAAGWLTRPLTEVQAKKLLDLDDSLRGRFVNKEAFYQYGLAQYSLRDRRYSRGSISRIITAMMRAS